MAEVTLLRHGQASFGSENYDRLSNIGHRQSFWLGQHLKNLDESFDRIVSGTMQRHHETAQGVLKGLQQDIDICTHSGLNEYDFQGLLTPFRQQHPEQWLETGHGRRDYYHNMKQALTYWIEGSIESDGQDSWQSFCDRIRAGFLFACEGEAKRTLIVSSGGPIAVILAELLQLAPTQICNLTLQIKNSSASKLLFRRPHVTDNALNKAAFTLDTFNSVSHLESEDRRHSITFS